MKIRKDKILDYLCMVFAFALICMDFFGCLLQADSLLIIVSFIPIMVLAGIVFFNDTGFITIDQMLGVYLFMFCYYTPIHQYTAHTNIHRFSQLTGIDYLYANLIILLFELTYLFGRKYNREKKSKEGIFKDVKLGTFSLFLLMVLGVGCLVWLQGKHVLFSTGESTFADSSVGTVILKIIRFVPVSTLLIYIFARRDKMISGNKKVNDAISIVIFLIFLVVFFPLNGVISRYLLFGTYLMVLHTIFENGKKQSLIIAAAFIGFYLIFPAFNFFKFHNLREISQFRLGGFDATFIDYDAYEMLICSIHYVSEHGVLFGLNILTAILCIVPRSIWTGKLNPTGAIIAESNNAAFLNLSCPIYAEFYMAFGIFGVICGTIVFSRFVNFLEDKLNTKNIFWRSMYSIAVGMIIPFSRGAMLPMMSFWISLIIALMICCLVCSFTEKRVGTR